MNQGWTYHDQVSPNAAGQSLLDYYTQQYQHSMRAEWLARIEQGQIIVDGQPAQAEQVLRAGQHLAYHRAPWQEPPVPLTFTVLYEDDDVLVIAKPVGLPVLPGGQFLEHTLLHQLRQRYPQSPPSPVHRLGRGTSGVMLLARSPLAKADLSQQFRPASRSNCPSPSMRKTYRALIGPAADVPDTFEMTTPIGKIPYPGLGTLHAATPTGKWAYSQGRVLARRATQTLLEVTILTGRPHQIRIHLAAIGYPLLGDPLYGPGGQPRAATTTQRPVPSDLGYCLHAYQLHLLHPRTRAPLHLVCPPPPCLQLTECTTPE